MTDPDSGEFRGGWRVKGRGGVRKGVGREGCVGGEGIGKGVREGIGREGREEGRW